MCKIEKWRFFAICVFVIKERKWYPDSVTESKQKYLGIFGLFSKPVFIFVLSLFSPILSFLCRAKSFHFQSTNHVI